MESSMYSDLAKTGKEIKIESCVTAFNSPTEELWATDVKEISSQQDISANLFDIGY
jgi:hypothetical protein